MNHDTVEKIYQAIEKTGLYFLLMIAFLAILGGLIVGGVAWIAVN